MRNQGAALIIDYGHDHYGLGDTLQAVAGHSFTDPLRAPGKADLTAHVDFEALAQCAESMGARIHGPIRQRELFLHLGIEKRAAALKASAPLRAADIEVAFSRLIAEGARGMGELFKAIAIAAPALGPLPGFETPIMKIEAASLTLTGIRHAFFTRAGGVSGGLYQSLNGGTGSRDDTANVAQNRTRMATALGVEPNRLLTAYQIHSPTVVVAEAPWSNETRPRADAIVTRLRALAIGVTTADCGPVLLADPQAHVIGAAHAGWRGALTGVIEATVAAMEQLGAARRQIRAAIGPMIRHANYEVGPDLIARFAAEDRASNRFFSPAARDGHALFDLSAAMSRRGSSAPASDRSRTLGFAPMPIRTAFSAIAAPPIAPSPITAAISMRLRSWPISELRMASDPSLSSAAKADDPVVASTAIRDGAKAARTPVTGCSAFAEHDKSVLVAVGMRSITSTPSRAPVNKPQTLWDCCGKSGGERP